MQNLQNADLHAREDEIRLWIMESIRLGPTLSVCVASFY